VALSFRYADSAPGGKGFGAAPSGLDRSGTLAIFHQPRPTLARHACRVPCSRGTPSVSRAQLNYALAPRELNPEGTKLLNREPSPAARWLRPAKTNISAARLSRAVLARDTLRVPCDAQLCLSHSRTQPRRNHATQSRAGSSGTLVSESGPAARWLRPAKTDIGAARLSRAVLARDTLRVPCDAQLCLSHSRMQPQRSRATQSRAGSSGTLALAMASISTLASRGSLATCTQARAGGF